MARGGGGHGEDATALTREPVGKRRRAFEILPDGGCWDPLLLQLPEVSLWERLSNPPPTNLPLGLSLLSIFRSSFRSHPGNSEIFSQQDCSALESSFLPSLSSSLTYSPNSILQGPSLVSEPQDPHFRERKDPNSRCFPRREGNMRLHLEASSLTPSPFPHRILLSRTTSYPSESPSVPDLLVTNYRFLCKPPK